MVEATDFANRDDPAEFRPLNWAAVGRILVEREVSTRPVVVREVASQGAAQVPFAKDEDVIQTLAPDGADEPLREGVLPRAVRRREDFTDAHALHALPEHVTVDRVAVAEEIGRRGVVREGVHDLLGGPVGRGVVGHVEVDDAPAMVNEHDEHEEDAQARGGNREEVEGDQISDMVGEERPPRLRRLGTPLRHQPGDGSLGHADTELQELAMDSWGAQTGFAVAMRVIKVLISAWTAGRPPGERPESLLQYSRKRRRCHRRTVLAVTITRGCLHPAQTLASQIQKRRSVVRSLGRAVVLLYTASCCRRARFSTASWRWPPKRNGRSRSTWSKRVIIEPRFSPDQRRQINDLPPAEVLAKDRLWKGLPRDGGSQRLDARSGTT